MRNIFKAKLLNIQPSQLYICSEKLSRVIGSKSLINAESFEPVPVKKLGSRVIFTDGHTRAFALFQSGITEIYAYWDTDDELDWEAYQICVDWCIKQNIYSIKDLNDRIVSEQDYQKLWLKRCSVMQCRLAEKRKCKQNI